jgi:hypothetical protein
MMNRRDFMINSALTGLAAAQIPGILAAVPENTFRPARWLENGLIDAGGSHEPYIFLVRRGGGSRDAREVYERQQSEPVIRKLKEQGIEVFHTHLYKGFGMAAEKPEMEDAKRAAEVAHRYGMKVDTYIQWNTMMYETFFAEEPSAKDWIQRDIAGRPILLTYGYQQSYRYRPCFANQAYLDYLKKIVQYAVIEAKTDFIHFDNFDLNPEPDSCHCPSCVQGFRNRLKAKYSPRQRKERFGFENTDFVNPPQWNFQNPPQRMEIIFDPAIQEWIDFRCQLMADALKQLALYAKSLNPEVAIEINPHGITGGNRAWASGIDHARILKWTEVFWTEEQNPAGLSADGRLITKIRSFKLARTFHNILMTPFSDDSVAIAESLAFNQTIGYAGQDPIHPAVLKYIAFYRTNRDLFAATEDVASVAVLRSYPSIAYHNMRAQLAAVLVEQALIQTRIPFDLIFDEHLADMSKYKVLILPDSECLSDEQLSLIRRFVEQGGGLVATGPAGLYDEWHRLRVEPGLRGLVDGQRVGDGYVERVKSVGKMAADPTRKEYGSGRAIYFASILFDGEMPAPEPYFEINNKYWKLPTNWQEIAEGVRWASRAALPARVKGPQCLVANLVSQSARKRMLLHLVNYDARKTSAIKSIEVACSVPQGASAQGVVVYSPDLDAPQTLSSNASAGEVSFIVPEVKVYLIACINW